LTAWSVTLTVCSSSLPPPLPPLAAATSQIMPAARGAPQSSPGGIEADGEGERKGERGNGAATAGKGRDWDRDDARRHRQWGSSGGGGSGQTAEKCY
jgi:hypothetical protein